MSERYNRLRELNIRMLKEKYKELVQYYHEEKTVNGKSSRIDDMEIELYTIEDELKRLGVKI